MILLQTENGHTIKQGFKIIDQVSGNAFITTKTEALAGYILTSDNSGNNNYAVNEHL